MRWLIALGTAGLAALAAGGWWWLRRSYVVVTITGPSMEPTYRDGDRVFVRRRPLSVIRPGDIVVIARPDAAGWMIKRVVAVPGQAPPVERIPSLSALAPTRVPEGTLVLLGDNPSFSKDSQRYGYLAADRLLGRVVHPRRPQTPAGDDVRRPEPRGFRGDHQGHMPGPTAEGQHDAEVP